MWTYGYPPEFFRLYETVDILVLEYILIFLAFISSFNSYRFLLFFASYRLSSGSVI